MIHFFLLLFSFLKLSHSETEFSDNDYVYILYDNFTAAIKSSISQTIISIPSYVNYDMQYNITTIEKNAFSSTTFIGETFQLPENLISIKSRAFYRFDCTNNDLIFPESLIEIESYAFTNAKFKSILFNEKITEIPDNCFAASTLTSLNFTNNLITISKKAFSFSNIQEGIVLPDSLISIGERAFERSQINSIVFGKNLIEIQSEAFINCVALNCDIKLPRNIRTIGSNVFRNSGILSVELPYLITIIPKGMFQECYHLSGDIILSMYLSEIEENAFSFTNISSIVFEPSVYALSVDIGYRAFYMCTNLRCSFPLHEFSHISEEAFAFCSFRSLPKIICESIGDNAFSYCDKATGNIILSATEINNSVFSGCSLISSIFFNSSCKVIPIQFCYGCTSLKEVKFINNSIEVISREAFSLCSNLQTFQFGSSIEQIEKRAFYYCSSLHGPLNLNDMSNLSRIEDESFIGCDSIVGELHLPNSLEYIGASAFLSCQCSGSLEIPNNVEEIGSYAFFGCSYLTGSLKIGSKCKIIHDSAFALCNGFSGNLILGDKIENIDSNSFFGCSSFSGNLILPESLQSIGDNAFMNCNGFSGQLILPSSINYIGKSAFSGCKELSGTLTIPSSVQLIGETAFFGCVGFIDVHFESDENINVSFMAFSRMHIKCFQNPPKSFKNNKPELYSSDNFDGKMLPAGLFNLNCKTFYALDTICIILSAFVSSSALFAILGIITKLWSNHRNNKSRLSAVFGKIIKNNVEKFNDIIDFNGKSTECTQNIINSIRDRIELEMEWNGFNASSYCIKSAIKLAIQKEWCTVLPEVKDKIVSKSTDDFIFPSMCSYCCPKKNKYNKDFSADMINGHELATSLL